jgi:DNA-binding MarR family transcriptional regulator
MSPSGMRGELAIHLGEQVRAFQRSVDAGDDEIARLLGLNRTDLRCLDTLMQNGPSAPSRLATELGLTTGSATATSSGCGPPNL